MSRVGEVIEASTAEFISQCYELYQSPPLGSLVKTADLPVELYGIVYNASTSSIDPGRRPIARGKDETSEEAIFQSSPQLQKLFRTEFSAVMVGHKEGKKLHYFLPPKPARIHSFVYQCSADEVREFSQSFAFLNTLLDSRLQIPVEELIGASLRQMSQVQPDPQAFLVTAGKELAVLLSTDFIRLNSILRRLKG
jgi:hypothetical protein